MIDRETSRRGGFFLHMAGMDDEPLRYSSVDQNFPRGGDPVRASVKRFLKTFYFLLSFYLFSFLFFFLFC